MPISLKTLRTAALVGLAAIFIAGQALAAGWSWPFDGGREVTGESLYRSRCGGCHALDHNRYGPSHQSLWMRPAGVQPGYRYSAALAHSGLVWNAETLDTWLTNPRRMVPGTRMDASVGDPEHRRLIIAYLKRQTARPGA